MRNEQNANAAKPSNRYRPLSDVAAMLRSRDLSAVELWAEAEARHGEMGERLNAYAVWSPERARAMAEAADAAFAAGMDTGPLQGLPISFKDNYGIQAYPTYAGTSKRLPEKWEHEGPVVRDTKGQLATITGKTHLVEFAASGIGDNPHWGCPRNPWDAKSARGTGGSSSGAGISLWEGSAKVAFGSDTRGSVRIPGAMSGVVGLKISTGRWSNEGIVPLVRADDTPGPLTLTVQDAAYVFAALDPIQRRSRRPLLEDLTRVEICDFKIGIADECFWEGCSPGVAEAVHAGLSDLEKSGATLKDAPSPESRKATEIWTNGDLGPTELFAFIESELPEWIDQLEPRLKDRYEQSGQVKAVELLKQALLLEDLAANASRCFVGVDIIVAPTVPVTPPVLVDGRPESKDSAPPPMITARNTSPANFFEWCAITLPVGFDAENMPVGLQMMAPAASEEKLLAAAIAAERVLGNVHQRLGTPPLFK